MTATSITWTEETVDAPGMQLHLIKGGAGAPLLVMHDEIGHPGWLRFHPAGIGKTNAILAAASAERNSGKHPGHPSVARRRPRFARGAGSLPST